MTEAVAEILGVRRKATNLADIAQLIEDGLPGQAVEKVKDLLDLTDLEMASTLGVSPKTISRARSKSAKLTLAIGDKLFRLAHIFAIAQGVLGSDQLAIDWLRNPKIGLGNRVPLNLLRTGAGSREVEDLLGRIEYGVIS